VAEYILKADLSTMNIADGANVVSADKWKKKVSEVSIQ
jgi:hypothetical protein